MSIKMIWAVSEDGWIGKDGKLPWHVPTELEHFRSLTERSLVVMGRKTWESIGCKPLKNRGNIVMSKSGSFQSSTIFMDDYQDVLELAKNETVWVIGGRQIYDLFMPYADELHVSVIPDPDYQYVGDTREPNIGVDWEHMSSTQMPGFTYEVYLRSPE